MNILTTRKPMKRTGFKHKQPAPYKTAALGPSTTLIEKRDEEAWRGGIKSEEEML